MKKQNKILIIFILALILISVVSYFVAAELPENENNTAMNITSNFTNESLINISDYPQTAPNEISISDINPNSVDTCGTLNLANAVYNLTANLTSNETCLTITADNITVNGNMFTINYSANSTLGYGVYGKDVNFTTIKNLVVQEGTNLTDYKSVIFFENSNNSLITNNIISTSGYRSYGIQLNSTPNSVINDNTISTSGELGQGIRIEFSLYSIITNNTLSTSGVNAHGILDYLNSDFSIIKNNNIVTSSVP